MALAAIAGLLTVLLGSAPTLAGPADQRVAPHGSAGIGDPYFPLDGNGGIDVLTYDVHDRYDFGPGRISGWTRVTLRPRRTLSGFNLDFLLPVSSVRIDGARVRWQQKRHELVIDHRIVAGRTIRVVVRYRGLPARYSIAGESNWLADDQEVVAMNEPHMAPWWFPANDHPRDKARMEIHITVPKRFQVIANGTRVRRQVRGQLATTHWSATEPMAPYLAFFAAGRFTTASGVRDGLPWTVAVSQGLPRPSRQAAMGLMKKTPALVSWLETQLGDYPFSSTGGVTTALPVGFALENQTRPTYPSLLSGDGVSIAVHELAHQWFGDSVSVARWRDIWLNEGAATFMEVRYWESRGDVAGQSWLLEQYAARPAGDDFWHHRVAEPCPSNIDCVGSIFAGWVYQRGAMALQALRTVIGDDDFTALLRRWVRDREGGNGSSAQFEALAEQISGEDLDAFFDAWLHSPTKPARTAANGLV